MFRWYQRSSICYVYLSDVPSRLSDGFTSRLMYSDPHYNFKHSRWFTRGWTLQELIAPTQLVFFAKDWVEIGTKVGLSRILEEITGVPVQMLNFETNLSFYNVATRMSWAAGRETTREEDIAYCLFGIFNIN